MGVSLPYIHRHRKCRASEQAGGYQEGKRSVEVPSKPALHSSVSSYFPSISLCNLLCHHRIQQPEYIHSINSKQPLDMRPRNMPMLSFCKPAQALTGCKVRAVDSISWFATWMHQKRSAKLADDESINERQPWRHW
jgi:hypothetical protein